MDPNKDSHSSKQRKEKLKQLKLTMEKRAGSQKLDEQVPGTSKDLSTHQSPGSKYNRFVNSKTRYGVVTRSQIRRSDLAYIPRLDTYQKIIRWKMSICEALEDGFSLSPPSEDIHPIVPMEEDEDEDENLEISSSMIGNNMQFVNSKTRYGVVTRSQIRRSDLAYIPRLDTYQKIIRWKMSICEALEDGFSLSPPSEDIHPIVPMEEDEDEDENLESSSMIGNNMQYVDVDYTMN